MVISRLTDFKKKHRLHYWTRLFLAVWIVGQLLMTGLVHGAVTHEEFDTYIHATYVYPGQKLFARAPNNNWLTLYPSTNNDALNMSRSTDNGSTWTDEAVVPKAWKGQSKIWPIGIHATYNNTTIIIFRTEDADNNYDTYIGYRWSDIGDWTFASLWSHATYDWDYATTAANFSHVCIVYQYNSQVRFTTWDWINQSIPGSEDDILVDTYVQPRPIVTVNNSGAFWLCYSKWDGSFYDYHFTNLGSTETFKYENIYNLVEPFKVDFQSLPNNKFYVFFMFFRNSYTYIYYWYCNSDGTGQTLKHFATTTDDYNYMYGGSSFNTTGYLYLFAMDETDGTVHRWDEEYDATEGEWQSSETTWLIISGTAYLKTSPNLYPRYPSGNYTDIPLTGFIIPWIQLDGADYTFWLSHDVDFEWYDWSPPEIPEEPGPGDDEGDTDISWALWWGDVACISTVMIAIVILLFIVIVVQMVSRR